MKEIINKLRSIFKLTPASSLHVDRPIEKPVEKTEVDRDSLIREYNLLVERFNQLTKENNTDTKNEDAQGQMFQQNDPGIFRGKTF